MQPKKIAGLSDLHSVRRMVERLHDFDSVFHSDEARWLVEKIEKKLNQAITQIQK